MKCFFFRLISSEECSNFTVEKWAYFSTSEIRYVEDEIVLFYTAPKKSRWLVPTKNWEERTSSVWKTWRLGVVVIILVDGCFAMLEVPNRTLEQAKVRRWCWACQCIVSLTFDICFSSIKQVVENCCILLNKYFAVVFIT